MSPAVDGMFGSQSESLVGTSFVDHLDAAGIEQ